MHLLGGEFPRCDSKFSPSTSIMAQCTKRPMRRARALHTVRAGEPCVNSNVCFRALTGLGRQAIASAICWPDAFGIGACGGTVDGGAERALLPRGELRVALVGESAMHLLVRSKLNGRFPMVIPLGPWMGVEGGFEGSRDALLVPPRGAAARTATLS